MRLRILAAVLLSVWAGPALADWHRAESRHFIVYSNDSETRIRELATKLERYDKAMRIMRGLPDPEVSPSSRVTVYTLGSQDAVGALAGNDMVAGFYVPRASGSVAFVPRRSGTSDYELGALQTLLHEYAHHLLMTSFAQYAVPTWLNEGLAEFHATARFERDGSIMFGAAPQSRGWSMFNVRPMPAERMLANHYGRTPEEIDAFYGRSWMLTHMLTFSRERAGQLGRYVRLINEGRPIAEAAESFGPPEVLDRELNAYLRQRRITATTVPADQLAEIGAVTVTKLSDGAAAVMPARIRSTRGVNQETGPRVLAMARRAAAPYPSDAFAQRVLAECEYDVGNLAEAAAAADRAIAAEPEMVDALLYRGMVALAEAQAKGAAATPADWSAARRWFMRANAAENDAPMPLMMFHASYLAEGREPTDNARLALARAQELAPHDLGLRMSAAMMYLGGGGADNARALLRPVAYSPHGGGASVVASAVIAALDEGGAEAGLRLMRDGPPPAPATAEGAED